MRLNVFVLLRSLRITFVRDNALPAIPGSWRCGSFRMKLRAHLRPVFSRRRFLAFQATGHTIPMATRELAQIAAARPSLDTKIFAWRHSFSPVEKCR